MNVRLNYQGLHIALGPCKVCTIFSIGMPDPLTTFYQALPRKILLKKIPWCCEPVYVWCLFFFSFPIWRQSQNIFVDVSKSNKVLSFVIDINFYLFFQFFMKQKKRKTTKINSMNEYFVLTKLENQMRLFLAVHPACCNLQWRWKRIFLS